MADPKKEAARGVVLTHADAPASFTHSDGTSYSTDPKTGLVEVTGEHVADAQAHGFAVPAKKEQAK
jgi:hypothetical protein